MLKVTNVAVPLRYDDNLLKKRIAEKLKVRVRQIQGVRILKRSIDARRGHPHYIMSFAVDCKCQTIAVQKDVSLYVPQTYQYIKAKSITPPVIIGAGPAGLFAAYVLAQAGLKPIVVERGECVDVRKEQIKAFFCGKQLNEECNVQFGEGGAGAFSDGKLNTGVNDFRMEEILRIFVKFGAPESILIDAKPHIGTDHLISVIVNLRNAIRQLGGQFFFGSKFTDFTLHDGKITSVSISTKKGDFSLPCEALILAIGHSARDTFAHLHKKGMVMQAKNFSVGVRVEHLQAKIDRAQYGDVGSEIGAADYKLWCHLGNGRSAYTFCMCPGGTVLAATSEKNAVVTNGMSHYARDGKNANSALLVSVGEKDFRSDHPLAGIEFQRTWERAAFELAGDYRAPACRLEDFLEKRTSLHFGEVLPTYPIGTVMSDFATCLPAYVTDALREAIPVFETKLKGFASPDAVITGVETRSSSPVRILREERSLQSVRERGIYPAGEGAGYAGGIMSAAADGMKCAEKIVQSYQNF